jgi:hypothetical protein
MSLAATIILLILTIVITIFLVIAIMEQNNALPTIKDDVDMPDTAVEDVVEKVEESVNSTSKAVDRNTNTNARTRVQYKPTVLQNARPTRVRPTVTPTPLPTRLPPPPRPTNPPPPRPTNPPPPPHTRPPPPHNGGGDNHHDDNDHHEGDWHDYNGYWYRTRPWYYYNNDNIYFYNNENCKWLDATIVSVNDGESYWIDGAEAPSDYSPVQINREVGLVGQVQNCSNQTKRFYLVEFLIELDDNGNMVSYKKIKSGSIFSLNPRGVHSYRTLLNAMDVSKPGKYMYQSDLYDTSFTERRTLLDKKRIVFTVA